MRRPHYKSAYAVSAWVEDLVNKFEYPDELGVFPPQAAAQGGEGGAPTIFIAASNATEFSKSKADFIATGVDDDLLIESCLDLVATPGGRILLSEGTFTCGASITFTTARNYITLEGLGPQVTRITKANGVNVAVFDCDDNVIWTRIANLSIDGNKVNCTAGRGINWNGDYLFLENVYVHDTDDQGILTPAGANYHFIKNCIFDAAGHDGLSLSAAPTVVIGTTSRSNAQYGFYLNGAPQAVYGCYSLDNVNIGYFLNEAFCALVGNYSNNDELGIISGPGPNQIIGNVVRQPDTHGIQIQDNVGDVVIGNEVNLAGQHGILLAAADNVLVASNRILNAGRDTNNTYDGIHLSGSCDYAYIHGNRIVGNAGTPKPRYALNVAAGTNNNIHYVANMAGAAGDYGTGLYNDAGTGSVNVWPGAAAPQGDNF